MPEHTYNKFASRIHARTTGPLTSQKKHIRIGVAYRLISLEDNSMVRARPRVTTLWARNSDSAKNIHDVGKNTFALGSHYRAHLMECREDVTRNLLRAIFDSMLGILVAFSSFQTMARMQWAFGKPAEIFENLFLWVHGLIIAHKTNGWCARLNLRKKTHLLGIENNKIFSIEQWYSRLFLRWETKTHGWSNNRNLS